MVTIVSTTHKKQLLSASVHLYTEPSVCVCVCVRDFDRTRSLHSFCTWIPAFHSSSLGRSQNLLGEGWGDTIIHPPLSLCFKWRIFWTLAVRLRGDNWVCRGEREALLRWRGRDFDLITLREGAAVSGPEPAWITVREKPAILGESESARLLSWAWSLSLFCCSSSWAF